MLIAEAHVRTDRPSRYLAQLCMHPSQMGIHPGPACTTTERHRARSSTSIHGRAGFALLRHRILLR